MQLGLLLMLGGLVAAVVGFRLGGLAFFVGFPMLLLGLYGDPGDDVGGGAPDANASAALDYGSGMGSH